MPCLYLQFFTTTPMTVKMLLYKCYLLHTAVKKNSTLLFITAPLTLPTELTRFQILGRHMHRGKSQQENTGAGHFGHKTFRHRDTSAPQNWRRSLSRITGGAVSHRNCPGPNCPGFSLITALVSKCPVTENTLDNMRR